VRFEYVTPSDNFRAADTALCVVARVGDVRTGLDTPAPALSSPKPSPSTARKTRIVTGRDRIASSLRTFALRHRRQPVVG
jgi:hypothetical protein